jgi:serine/threonine protein kinase/Tol biopolymer transport system component
MDDRAMNAEQWERLTEWHNTWLTAAPSERQRLQDEFAAAEPDLAAQAQALAEATGSARGFLETPAFVAAARLLADEAPELAEGAAIGPYRILRLIARGGMGMVYRARDIRLDRDVALKMLATPAGMRDEQAVERFIQEARVTASVDHPNVVRVYDVGVFEGTPFMVVELLEGQTLRQRLNQGRMPTAEVCRIAVECAKGLMAAHAAGLVHRDLKPENVFLTRGNVSKILDFGIAKLAPEASQRAGASTLTGIVLGTVGYLAPEQIRAETVDGRADLFAFGSILFELITGQRAFACEETVDTLHAILHQTPPDIRELRPDVPRALVTIATRLLEKAPANRFQSAADLVWALEQVSPAPVPDIFHDARPQPARPPEPQRHWRPVAAVAGLAVLALAAAWSLWPQSPTSDAVPVIETRNTWAIPEGMTLASEPAVSPDGSRVAWAAVSDGVRRLFVRELRSLDAVAVAGTDGAQQPFWSPDGRSLAYFAAGKLKRIAIDGGTPVDLADAPSGRGGAWSRSGLIVFQPDHRDAALLRVPAMGGKTEAATQLDAENDELSHRWPNFLPDDDHFLYLTISTRDERRGIYLASVSGGPSSSQGPLFRAESNAIYVDRPGQPHGVLLSVANGRVETRPFDPATRNITADPRVTEIAAAGATPYFPALLAATPDILAYATPPFSYGSYFTTVTRNGEIVRRETERRIGGQARLSPDGRRLVRSIVDPLRGNPDIWVMDLQRGTDTKVTFGPELDALPVWSPSGSEVAHQSGQRRKPTLGIAAADGSGVARTIPCPEDDCEPTDWSPDGYVIVNVRRSDVWKIPVEPGRSAERLLTESFVERDARVSSDGKWIAYVSYQSGRPEVAVRSLSGPPAHDVISRGGGDQPVWRRDMSELFYADPSGQLFSVSVRPAGNRLEFGIPVKLGVPRLGDRHYGTDYEVSHDGQLIFLPARGEAQAPREIGVITGWSALLRR